MYKYVEVATPFTPRQCIIFAQIFIASASDGAVRSLLCYRSPFCVIFAKYEFLFDALSPVTQCFTIQGCRSTSSSGIRLSGSRTSN